VVFEPGSPLWIVAVAAGNVVLVAAVGAAVHAWRNRR
jgi:hypothetical protein